MILFSVLATIGAAVIISLLDKFYDDIIKWLKAVCDVITKKFPTFATYYTNVDTNPIKYL